MSPYKELSREFLDRLELKIEEIIDSKSEYVGSSEEKLFIKELCENIDKFEIVSGEIVKYTGLDKKYMIEYDIHPKRLKELVYRNLLYPLEMELTTMLGSKVSLFAY